MNISLSEPLFSTFNIDIAGPLPVSRIGYKFLVTCIDHYSRYLEAEALKDKKSQTIAKFLLRNNYLKYGSPKTILSDQGFENNNNFTEAYARL